MTSSNSSNNKNNNNIPDSLRHPFMHLLLGYVALNGIFTVVVILNAFLLLGLLVSPLKCGLYILLPYYTYTKFISLAELKHGNRWSYFSKNFIIFRMARKYLDMQFIVDDQLQKDERKPDAKFIIGMFPHGVASDHRVAMDGMLHTILPTISEKIKVLVASSLFVIPFVREVSLWTGCVDARRFVAERVLDNGDSILVFPGGISEQIATSYQQEKVYLKSRKGFIKLAMRKNIPVIPSYVFGVSDYYYTFDYAFPFRKWLEKSFGIGIPLAYGLWGSLFCPLPVKTTIVFGKPMIFETKVIGIPSSEELDTAHEKFCKALQDLFDEHKQKLGYGDRKLIIQ